MQTGSITTPFGRRAMTITMLASQSNAQDIDAEKSVDKWKLYRALCDARQKIGVTDRGLALLNALLSFYPKADLCVTHGLVVFPSNAQLSIRAHGMTEPTIRRHLAALVDAGLITRKDSANGKRYARRDDSGSIGEAFGFSLAPLIARADEIETLAAAANSERLQLQRLKERLTICRRDIAKLIDVAMGEGVAGDWTTVHLQFRGLVESIPRSADLRQLTDVLNEMELMREGVVNILEMRVKLQITSGNDVHNERHIQNSNTESNSELEPHKEKKERGESTDWTAINKPDLKSFPLGMVLQACPQISDYGPGGTVTRWRDMMAAAVVVRSMLGVSPSAYKEACEVLGSENAATVMACILEKTGQINSAGGYLRNLTARARKGEFGLGPMLMALLRTNGVTAGRTG